MNSSFYSRLGFSGDVNDLLDRIVTAYQLGKLQSYSLIEVGFEDFNIKLVTEHGDYLAKIFSKKRTHDEITRNVNILKHVDASDVNHPDLLLHDGSLSYTDPSTELTMVLMKFVAGKTFYDASNMPGNDDLALVAAEAVKINNIEYDPPYLFDGWAIPHMRPMFEKVKDHLTAEGLALVSKALTYYDAIPFDKLPKRFVHGDLTKANLIKGADGKIYVIDFSVANTYPRIQELAVIAANLLFDEKGSSTIPLFERVEMVIAAYEKAGGELIDIEKKNVLNYALPGAAMEYMGSVNERIIGDASDETLYWEKLGFDGLREALR